MAYTADHLAYDVISELAPREIEMKGPVWIMGRKYIYPRGMCSSVFASLSPGCVELLCSQVYCMCDGVLYCCPHR